MQTQYLPLGIQTFQDIIEEGYLYVDKTQDIYTLLRQKGKYYFLSRPRRFGKSLLVSTLKALFSGQKEFFKGLWIYNQIEWREYPIIHLDFSSMSYTTPEILAQNLGKTMDYFAKKYKIRLDKKADYKDKFKELLEKLALKEKVVILIDEYDKPIKNLSLQSLFHSLSLLTSTI